MEPREPDKHFTTSFDKATATIVRWVFSLRIAVTRSFEVLVVVTSAVGKELEAYTTVVVTAELDRNSRATILVQCFERLYIQALHIYTLTFAPLSMFFEVIKPY